VRKLAGAQESPVGVELVLEHGNFFLRVVGHGSISQEVKPEDEMATDSQNGDITVLSLLITKKKNASKEDNSAVL
jgi:hypothetical protein